MTAGIDVGEIVSRYESGRVQAHAVLRSTGEVVHAVLAELGFGPKVRRERVDLDHVNALVESGGANWPPIVVTGPTGTIIDGHHRASAARRLGWSTIPAVVVEVDHRSVEGLAAATKANIEHGLALSIPERKSVAARLIAETDWSDNRISDVCGLHRETVAKLRPRNVPGVDKLRGSLGRDGKIRPSAAEAVERRKAAAREISEKPTVSDREVAQRTGLSPRTVADVRKRNEAGEDPVPRRLRAVPKPEPAEPGEPKVAVGDVVPSVALPWVRDERCQASNAAREFARAMDRFTGKALAGVEEKVVKGCPPGEVAHMAAVHAREAAAMWTRIAEALSKPRPMEGT